MQTEMMGATELKGGLDSTGHRAPDFDARERAMRRRASARHPAPDHDGSLRACVRRNPFLSVGIAAGIGVILGALFAGAGR